jgi:hypothetical protein
MHGFVLVSNWRRKDRKEAGIELNHHIFPYIVDNIMHHPSELIMEALT